jgi:beta-N-acetylhexosaminidase
MTMISVAYGLRQAELDADLAAFFAEAKPWAFILFHEACDGPDQVRRLTDALREAVGREAIVWIDQEGGRVARLKPPMWPEFPAPAAFGRIYERDRQAGLAATRLGHRLMADELARIGVNGDYAPVLDVPAPGSHKIVGDRAFSADPEVVATLGAAALEGLAAGGVVGCVKHMPGHGRATADSHFDLPKVSVGGNELAADFHPFAALAHAPTAMTAHIVYEALDPTLPATLSPIVIGETIRKKIGFDGLLMSDDLDMKALTGPLPEKAAAALAAGCDVVLQCTGKLEDMIETAKGARPLAGKSLARAQAAEALASRPPEPLDSVRAWREFRRLLRLADEAVA